MVRMFHGSWRDVDGRGRAAQMASGSDDEFSAVACAAPTTLSWWISRASEGVLDARQVDAMRLWSICRMDAELM